VRRETDLALLGSAVCVSLFFCAAAAPASGAAARTVAIDLSASGKASWSTDGDVDHAQLGLTYRWHGTVTFSVPAAVLRHPARARFAVPGSATLTARWSGALRGERLGEQYRCVYRGANVHGRVTATLSNGRLRGSLRLVLHARGKGFFPPVGSGATATCSSRIGSGGPTHFGPAWLFRDNLEDHGRLTSNTAVLTVPAALLPRGSAIVTFPHEAGRVDQPLRPKLVWNNSGRLRLDAR
jgi:hypothetical protein